jgi:hypothetical protein
VATVVAPTTLIAALLYYFGYVLTLSRMRYFGIDPALLNYSVQDYMLRSVDAIYVPITVVLLLSLACVYGHALVRNLVDDRRHRATANRIAAGAIGAAVFFMVRGVVGIVVPAVAASERMAATPLSLGVGAALFAYSVLLLGRARSPGATVRRPSATEAMIPFRAAITTLTLLVAVVSLFWAVNSFASAYGRRSAEVTRQRLAELPGVVLDTREPLYVSYDGVETSLLEPTGQGAFTHRYQGLRLLLAANGRLFLLPENWTPESSATLVVRDDDTVRVQFHTG